MRALVAQLLAGAARTLLVQCQHTCSTCTRAWPRPAGWRSPQPPRAVSAHMWCITRAPEHGRDPHVYCGAGGAALGDADAGPGDPAHGAPPAPGPPAGVREGAAQARRGGVQGGAGGRQGARAGAGCRGPYALRAPGRPRPDLLGVGRGALHAGAGGAGNAGGRPLLGQDAGGCAAALRLVRRRASPRSLSGRGRTPWGLCRCRAPTMGAGGLACAAGTGLNPVLLGTGRAASRRRSASAGASASAASARAPAVRRSGPGTPTTMTRTRTSPRATRTRTRRRPSRGTMTTRLSRPTRCALYGWPPYARAERGGGGEVGLKP